MLAMTLRKPRAITLVVAVASIALAGLAQSDREQIVVDYLRWRELADPLPADEDPVSLFGAKLLAEGLSAEDTAASVERLRRQLIEEEG